MHIRQLLFRGGKKPESGAQVKHATSKFTSAYVADAQAEQDHAMKEQDESLDVVISGLNNLHDSGAAIRDEIDDQQKSLSRMDQVRLSCFARKWLHACLCVCVLMFTCEVLAPLLNYCTEIDQSLDISVPAFVICA